MKRSWSVLIISFFICINLFAQSTAQISGSVMDQSGAVLPGVQIFGDADGYRHCPDVDH